MKAQESGMDLRVSPKSGLEMVAMADIESRGQPSMPSTTSPFPLSGAAMTGETIPRSALVSGTHDKGVVQRLYDALRSMPTSKTEG
jgi:hypothetical protein